MMKKSQITKAKKVAKNKTIPAIDGQVIIEKGWATATNLEVTLRYRTEVEGEGIIPIEAISDGFDHAEIKGDTVFVKKGTVTIQYPAYNKAEFPTYDENDKELKSVQFNKVSQFKDLAKFAADDETRPVITGIYFDNNHMVATDAHKMRWYPHSNKLGNFIIPKIVADLMLEDKYRLSLVENEHGHVTRAIFRGEYEEIICRLIDGKYPRWIAVLPNENDLKLKLKVPTSALINALKAGLKVGNSITKAIIFDLAGSQLNVLAFDIDLKKEFTTSIALDREYGKMQFAYNTKFLLSVIDPKEVNTLLELQAAHKACFVNGGTLLMPIMIDKDITAVRTDIAFSTNDYEPTSGENYPGLYQRPIADAEPEKAPIQPEENNGAISDEQPEHVDATSEKQPEPEPVEASHDDVDDDVHEETPEAIAPEIVEYSEKAIAVIGDTKQYRREFKQIWGSWNPHVQVKGIKGAWIFSKKRMQQVAEILGQ